MKTKTYILFLLVFTLLQSCKAQQLQTDLPKIENYTKGELKIKVETFGSRTPIHVGKITTDGTIHFKFPKLDLNAMYADEEAYFFNMQTMARAVGFFVCHDKEVIENTETVNAIEIRHFFLYKYGQIVGEIHPASQEEVVKNDFAIGSSVSWFYSDGDGKLKATCSVYENDQKIEYELDRNTLRNKTSYDISFKEGWNIVQNKLLEKKDMIINSNSYSRRLIEEKTSVTKIPSHINWYMNYTANDEALEIEQQLLRLKPITKAQFKKWLPEKAADLTRTSYELDKALEDSDSKSNNAFLVFEKGIQKMEIAVIDGARVPVELKMAKFSFAMDEQFEREDKPASDTSVSDAADKGEVHHISKEDKEKKTSEIMSVFKDRIVLYASGENMTAKQLWEAIKTLDVASIIK